MSIPSMTIRQAAERAGVSIALIYRWCHESRLAHYRLGASGKRGKIMIAPADLEKAIADCRKERHTPAGL